MIVPHFEWMIDLAERARKRGDLRYDDILRHIHQALEVREAEPQRGLTLLEQAHALAERVQEPWLIMLADHLYLTVLNGASGDYSVALPIVDRTVAMTRTPAGARFPQRICVGEDQIRIWVGIDPLGYAARIESGIATMEAELPEDSYCRSCLASVRTRYAFELGRWDETWALLEQALTTELLPQELPALHTQLCLVAWRRGDWDRLRHWAAEGVASSRTHDLAACLAECIAWQAVLARRDGDEPAAQRLCRSAVLEAKRSLRPLAHEYFDALCAFHEMAREYDRAYQTRGRQLALLQGKEHIWEECRVRIEACRLLALQGRASEGATAAARQAAARLQQPDAVLEGLARLAGGDLTPFYPSPAVPK